MSDIMQSQDVLDAFLAALDTLADDKKAIEQSAARAADAVEQIREISAQSNHTAEQVREIADLAVERFNANEELHQTLIRLVKALDSGL